MKKSLLLVLSVVVLSCGDDKTTTASTEWSADTYGTYEFGCGDVTEGYEWSRDGDEYVLNMQTVAGCGAYRATMTFGPRD
ncbi:MAG: hypothetical protein R3E66_03420 [bacterium]